MVFKKVYLYNGRGLISLLFSVALSCFYQPQLLQCLHHGFSNDHICSPNFMNKISALSAMDGLIAVALLMLYPTTQPALFSCYLLLLWSLLAVKNYYFFLIILGEWAHTTAQEWEQIFLILFTLYTAYYVYTMHGIKS